MLVVSSFCAYDSSSRMACKLAAQQPKRAQPGSFSQHLQIRFPRVNPRQVWRMPNPLRLYKVSWCITFFAQICLISLPLALEIPHPPALPALLRCRARWWMNVLTAGRRTFGALWHPLDLRRAVEIWIHLRGGWNMPKLLPYHSILWIMMLYKDIWYP